MKTYRFILIFTFILSSMGVHVKNVSAQEKGNAPPTTSNEEVLGEQRDIYSGFDIPMPDISYYTKDEIINGMQFFEKERPDDDEYSGYRLFVPKTWAPAPDALIRNTVNQEGQIVGDIAKYFSNPNDTAKSEITITAVDLEHNISAKNWLLKHVLDYGYVLEGIDEKDWNRAEALGVIYNDDSLDYKDWIVAQINGKRVVIMKFSSPLYYWEQEKRQQATTAKSFRMLSYAKSFQHEMVPYDVTGYAEFMYPANWKLGTLNQSDFDRPSIRLINFDDYGEDMDNDGRKDEQQFSKGIISIQIVLYDNTGTSIADEVETQKNIAENMGIRPGKKLKHNIDMVFPKSMQLNMLEIYEGVSTIENNPNYEIWVAYMKNDEAYYFVTMLTPNRETRYFAWTENKSAFEAIVSSLEPISFYEE